MNPNGLKLGEYIEELEKKKADKSEQVRDGIEIYVGLWRKAMERGIVSDKDYLGDALEKIDSAGGLYAAAGD